jgi:photosystem II stability/assembly factor-like uncharacterized protein
VKLWAGTVGHGLWQADVDGEDWTHVASVPADAKLFSLAADRDVVFAGGEGVIYRQASSGWERLDLPEPGVQVWSLAVDPRAPDTVFAGCRPLALLRSDDGGRHWRALPLELPPATERPHTPRVTAILVEDHAVWCGVEVGGVFVSEDGGQRWHAVNNGLPSLDIHALARSGGALLAATPRGIARRDGRWSPASLGVPWRYCRALAPLPGRPGEVVCGLGDGPPGTRGAVVVSDDSGRTWHSPLFPGLAGSTVWTVATSPAAPDDVLAASIGGELFASDDAGRSWRRLPQSFTDVRSVLMA